VNDIEHLMNRVVAAASASDLLQPPVSDAELAEAERGLGFRLHPLLAELYKRVGNGGFGPGDSVLPLAGRPDEHWETSVVQGYLDRIPPKGSDTWWSWPDGVVPAVDWGCAMFARVDCRSDDGTVLLFEPNVLSGQDVSTACALPAPPSDPHRSGFARAAAAAGRNGS
jgi:hypothetical protein